MYRAETQLSKPSHKATDEEARAVWCRVPLYWLKPLNPSCLDSGLHIALEQACLNVESRAGSTVWGTRSATTVMQFAHRITWPDWNLTLSPCFPSHVSHTALAPWHHLFVNSPKSLSAGWPCQEAVLAQNSQTGPHIYISGDTSKRCYTYSYRDSTSDWRQKTDSSFNLDCVPKQDHLSLVMRPLCESEKGSPIPANMMATENEPDLNPCSSPWPTCTFIPGGATYTLL